MECRAQLRKSRSSLRLEGKANLLRTANTAIREKTTSGTGPQIAWSKWPYDEAGFCSLGLLILVDSVTKVCSLDEKLLSGPAECEAQWQRPFALFAAGNLAKALQATFNV